MQRYLLHVSDAGTDTVGDAAADAAPDGCTAGAADRRPDRDSDYDAAHTGSDSDDDADTDADTDARRVACTKPRSCRGRPGRCDGDDRIVGVDLAPVSELANGARFANRTS